MGENNNNNENITNEVAIKNSDMIPFNALIKFKKCICNVKTKNGSGTGFLVKIYRKRKDEEQKNKFYCLITCEHVIEESYIKNKKEITIQYDYNENKFQKLSIKLNEYKRFIRGYQYLGIDATVVQIMEDEIKDEYFYFIDENNIDILKEFNENYQKYKEKQIFIFQIPGTDNNMIYSTGTICSRIDLNSFYHNSSTEAGSSGSPILFYSGDKINIIGIHKGGKDKKKTNVGNFIQELVESLVANRHYDKRAKFYIAEVIEGGHKKGTFLLGHNEYFIGEIWQYHRKGTIYKNKKEIYSGEFFKEKYHGKGTLFLENGNYYKGDFVENKREGKGILYNQKDEIIYEGEFIDDQFDGNGKLYYENGEFFKGKFSKGIKSEEEIKVTKSFDKKKPVIF